MMRKQFGILLITCLLAYLVAKVFLLHTSVMVAVILIILSVLMIAITGSRQRVSDVLCRIAFALLPLSHLAIVLSDFISVTYMVIGAFVVMGIINIAVLGGKGGRLRPYQVMFFLFALYLGISLAWAIDLRTSAKQYIGFLIAIIFFIGVQISLQPSWSFRKIRNDYILFGAAFGILAMLQIIFGERFYPSYYFQFNDSYLLPNDLDFHHLQMGVRSVRAIGPFFNPNAFGVFMLLPYTFALHTLFKRKHIGSFLALILIMGGIFATFSRGVYVLTGLSTILIILLYRGRYKLINAALLGLAGLLVLQFISSNYGLTVLNMFTGDTDNSLLHNTRYQYWTMAMNMFLGSPLLGIGYGNVGYNIQGGFLGFDPHNSYLTILVNHGLVGFMLLISGLVSVYWELRRVLKEGHQEILPVFVAFLLYLLSMMMDGLFLGEAFVYLLPCAFIALCAQTHYGRAVANNFVMSTTNRIKAVANTTESIS